MNKTGTVFDSISIKYSTSCDPYESLAYENYLLDSVGQEELIVLFWVNSPCVVIGRFQNPWIECNLSRMVADDVKLVRRQSGGGTVYHDEGNLNFSFITSKKNHNKEFSHGVIVQCLDKLGIKSFASPRGDLRIEEEETRKFSGSAFKVKKDAAFHHGTTLFNSDLDKLNTYIHSGKANLSTKSIASVRSVVANLSDIRAIEMIDLIRMMGLQLSSFSENIILTETITHEELTSSIDLDYLSKIRSNEWRIEQTPKFVVEGFFEGVGDIRLVIKNCVFESVEIETDLMHPSFVKELEKSINGRKLDFTDIERQLTHLRKYSDSYIDSFINWLKSYFVLDINGQHR